MCIYTSADLEENTKRPSLRFFEPCIDKSTSPSTESFVLDHGLDPAGLERCRKAPSCYTRWVLVTRGGCGHGLAAAARKPNTFGLGVQEFKSPQDPQERG